MIYRLVVLLAVVLVATAHSSHAKEGKPSKSFTELTETDAKKAAPSSTKETNLDADDANGDDKNPNSAGASQECTAITADAVRALFNSWATDLLTTPEQVVSHYWHNSILIPTLSNVIRSTDSTKLAYFEHFCAKKPVASIVEDFVDLTGCNEAQYNGLYNFALTDPVTGAASVANARFSYTFQTYDGKTWKIKTHHSSLLRNPVGGARRLRGADADHEFLNFNVATY